MYLRCIDPTPTLGKNNLYWCCSLYYVDKKGNYCFTYDLSHAKYVNTTNDNGYAVRANAERFEVPQDIWVTATGSRISIKDMDTDHIQNCLSLFKRKYYNPRIRALSRYFAPKFFNELKKRNVKDLELKHYSDLKSLKPINIKSEISDNYHV